MVTVTLPVPLSVPLESESVFAVSDPLPVNVPPEIVRPAFVADAAGPRVSTPLVATVRFSNDVTLCAFWPPSETVMI